MSVKNDLELSSYSSLLNNMIETIHSNEEHLFDATEWDVILQYWKLTDEAKTIFFRLLTRKDQWIRLDKTKWAWDNHLFQTSIDMLGTLKYPYVLIGSDDLTLTDCLKLLNKEEIQSFVANWGIVLYKSMSADDLRKTVVEILNDLEFEVLQLEKREETILHSDLWMQMERYLGCIVRIPSSIKDIFDRLGIAYNRALQWPDEGNFLLPSILTNLKTNAWKFPEYRVQRISLTWPTRSDLVAYSSALALEHYLQNFVI